MSIYSYKANSIQGQEISLDKYKGQVVLIVNTASKCGLTPQFEGLQKLYETYKDRGFVVLGFPCNQFGGQDPDSNEMVNEFCQLNYGVTFPMFEKIEVNGDNKHPLFAHLIAEQPFQGEDQGAGEGVNKDELKWNFTKFLVNRQGEVVARIEPAVAPAELQPSIEALL
ncbi:MAG: glutathione peroxidase [Candidatus Cohnella colombiensis]|uniref:Glutathione peroxidase n=1 Tax=Candidatus Cohnella colombiensis TaxID=3121368 RepID=A0AA95EW30_9BACL|nr:MAG: glutathione peroxidase [Cohnella sp.]